MLIALVALTTLAQSAGTTTIHSKASGETYQLSVSVPHGYEGSGAAYPVVYLLDGDWYFDMTAGMQRVMTTMQAIRPAILVGVGYGGHDVARHRERRFKEMTPSAVTERPGSGGADRFLAALREDVMPHVERQFRTNGERFLIGHSLGGLFSAVAMIRQPAMFQGYGVLSPSLWWDKETVFAEEARVRAAGVPLRARVYLAVGADEHASTMVAPLGRLARTMASDPRYREAAVSHQVVPGTSA